MAIKYLTRTEQQELSRRYAQALSMLSQGDWASYIFCNPLQSRVASLIEISDRVTDREYWELVENVWTTSEFQGHRNRRHWLKLFTAPRGERASLMSEEEHYALAQLPDPVVIYRGVGSPKYARGMSWTVDESRAYWFAHRFSQFCETRTVLRTTVSKSKVLAHFISRNESEIVIDPRRIKFTQHENSTYGERVLALPPDPAPASSPVAP